MQIKLFKETTVPSQFEKGSIYFVKPAELPEGAPENYMEIYVSNNNGDVIVHTPTWGDITSAINNKIVSTGSLVIVEDISARDGLESPKGEVYVRDASGDPTVNSGGAKYLYDTTNSSWIKISEAETTNLVLNWASLLDKPESSANAIDTAVNNSHTHANKSQLDKIGEDSEGGLTYNGKAISTQWENTGW